MYRDRGGGRELIVAKGRKDGSQLESVSRQLERGKFVVGFSWKGGRRESMRPLVVAMLIRRRERYEQECDREDPTSTNKDTEIQPA